MLAVAYSSGPGPCHRARWTPGAVPPRDAPAAEATGPDSPPSHAIKGNILCLFNYIGGKFKLLEQLQPLFDEKEVFLDLFAGGGNVGINSSSSKVIFNDTNENLIDLIEFIKDTLRDRKSVV